MSIPAARVSHPWRWILATAGTVAGPPRWQPAAMPPSRPRQNPITETASTAGWRDAAPADPSGPNGLPIPAGGQSSHPGRVAILVPMLKAALASVPAGTPEARIIQAEIGYVQQQELERVFRTVMPQDPHDRNCLG